MVDNRSVRVRSGLFLSSFLLVLLYTSYVWSCATAHSAATMVLWCDLPQQQANNGKAGRTGVIEVTSIRDGNVVYPEVSTLGVRSPRFVPYRRLQQSAMSRDSKNHGSL